MASSTPSSSNLSANTNGANYGSALYSLFILFFMWGFMTVMNDILIPKFKALFVLSYFQSMLVQFAFFGAYFIGSLIYFLISVTSGDPIQKIGYKNGIIIGLLTSATGSGLFYPAALGNSYWPYLLALFILGLGFTMLQIAANPYVSILGKPETASSRLNLAQAFNSLGTTIGPLIGGFLMFKFFADSGADAVKWPYLAFAGVLLLITVFILFAPLPKLTAQDKIPSGAGALQFPQLKFGMLAIFFYVGGEVAIGSIFVNYLGLEKIGGYNEEAASTFLSLYWGGLMIGRFLGAIMLSEISQAAKKYGLMAGSAILTFLAIYFANAFNRGLFQGETDNSVILEVLSYEIWPWLILIGLNLAAFVVGRSLPARTLSIFAAGVLALLVVTITGSGKFAFWAIIGIGLFNSIMWSNIFTLAIHKLGKYTSQGSSLLVMMILGGALIPPIQGALADALGTEANPEGGVQLSFIIPFICFLYILFYGLKGYKPGGPMEE